MVGQHHSSPNPSPYQRLPSPYQVPRELEEGQVLTGEAPVDWNSKAMATVDSSPPTVEEGTARNARFRSAATTQTRVGVATGH